MSRPTLKGSEPLSLTESHLSAEAHLDSARDRRSPLASLPSAISTTRSQASSQTLAEEDHDVPISSHASSDRPKGGNGADGEFTEKQLEVLEKGKVGPDEEPKVPVLASDGTPVIVVDWTSDSDPACPKNWSNRRRMGATLIVAAFTFLSPMSSTFIAPASGQIAERLNITSEVEISMITSIFVLAYAIGPLVLGPLSELYGRAIVLQSSNLLYLLFNFVCGFATTKEQLLAFRFMAGLGGSAPLAIGAGVLGDLWRAEERGRAAALYSIGPLLGPAIGPIAGAWISEKLPGDGYRWVFFSTTIFCTLVQCAGFIWLKETYTPVLLHRKAQAMKKEMHLSPDSDKVQTIYDIKQGKKSPTYVITHGLVRPFVMFYEEPILQILTLMEGKVTLTLSITQFMSITYGTIYIFTVTVTGIFTNVYHESVGIASTNFVAQGLGFFVWSQIQARLLDVVYRKLKARYGEGQPEFRLPMMIPASVFLPLGLLLYGWGAQHHLHWIVVDMGMFFCAAGMIGIFQCITTYVIDAFTLYAASALAAAACFRSLCGFGFPLFAPALFNKLGYGWGCTLLALVAMVVGVPAAPVLYTYGERIRKSSRHAQK